MFLLDILQEHQPLLSGFDFVNILQTESRQFGQNLPETRKLSNSDNLLNLIFESKQAKSWL
jgi:hypothetical protein